MNIVQLLSVYLQTVEQLLNQKLPNGGRLYIETNRGKYISFKPKDFRLKLQSVTLDKSINQYLSYFKRLGLIIATEKDSFTCVQRYKKKVVRVITIDRKKVEAVKELMESNDT